MRIENNKILIIEIQVTLEKKFFNAQRGYGERATDCPYVTTAEIQ
jgi:hypothetical protein